MFIAMYFWFSHGLRVYNKFKWEETGTTWDQQVDEDEEAQPLLQYIKRSRIDRETTLDLGARSSSSPAVAKEGHLSIKVSVGVLESWVRKYFVLVDTALFQFESQTAYEQRPNQPANRRPVQLSSYKLEVHESKAEALESSFEFSLLSVYEDADGSKRVWTFKCDTIDELADWTKSFSDSIILAGKLKENQDSDPHDHHGRDYINIY
jgi:hypothetical protein